MRFYHDQPDYWHEVRWYYVPPDRPELGLVNQFYSRIWELKEEYPENELGEMWSGRAWARGDAPYYLGGKRICGTPEQWERGCSSADPRPIIVDGIPACCGGPVLLSVGGKIQGGNAQRSIAGSVAHQAGGVLVGGLVGSAYTIAPAGGLLVGGGVTTDFALPVGGGVLVGGQAAIVPNPTTQSVWIPGHPIKTTLRQDVIQTTAGCNCVASTSSWHWQASDATYRPAGGTCQASFGHYLAWGTVGAYTGAVYVAPNIGQSFVPYSGGQTTPFSAFVLMQPTTPICNTAPLEVLHVHLYELP